MMDWAITSAARTGEVSVVSPFRYSRLIFAILLGVMLGLVSWTGLARLVRDEFLGLREREFVDAA